MKPLIDGDIILHEVAACGQYTEGDELIVRDFQFVADLADQRIKEICAEVWATEDPVLYFTCDYALTRAINKERKRKGEQVKEHKENFRKETAKKEVYKGTRKTEKPKHFKNLRAYLLATYECKVAEGCEADDLLASDLYADGDNLSVICCSRDKDLRMVPGMHYGWAVGKQPAYGPIRVTELGELTYVNGKCKGNGLKFFYAQTIMGDRVDNIPGIPGRGDLAAYKSLHDCESEKEMYSRVSELYQIYYGEGWYEEFCEQAKLAWMVREFDEQGEPIHYTTPDRRVDA